MSIHSQNTANSTRHVGTYGDKRVAIIIQDPNSTHEVHVIDTDSLPDAYHQNLMDLMMRPEAQASKWLGEYLHRQMLFDGTNALRQFYEKKWIQQVPVTSVYLTPRPNQRVSLAEVLGIAINQGSQTQQTDHGYNPLSNNSQPAQPLNQDPVNYNDIIAQEQAKLDQFDTPPAPDTYNQHVQNFLGDASEQNRMVANNLIEEAKMLESDAAAKRAMAAQYDASTTTQAATFTPSAQPSNNFNPLTNTSPEPVKVPVMDGVNTDKFVDGTTGKEYASASALKGAITRRENAAKKAGNG